jgi:hypothetical protein
MTKKKETNWIQCILKMNHRDSDELRSIFPRSVCNIVRGNKNKLPTAEDD